VRSASSRSRKLAQNPCGRTSAATAKSSKASIVRRRTRLHRKGLLTGTRGNPISAKYPPGVGDRRGLGSDSARHLRCLRGLHATDLESPIRGYLGLSGPTRGGDDKRVTMRRRPNSYSGAR
jgi:hypothetical protein